MMDKETTLARLDQIALDMATLDFDDLRNLMGVQEALQEITDDGPAPLPPVAQRAIELCTQTLLEEVGDYDDAMGAIGEAIELLQQLAEGDDIDAAVAAWHRRVDALLGEAPADDSAGGQEPVEADTSASTTTPTAATPTAARTSPAVASPEIEEGPPVEHDDLFFAFVTEANEHLEAAENVLLEMMSAPPGEEALNELFRSFHTIKGASGFINLIDVSNVTHAAESLMDLARKGSLSIEGARKDAIFAAIDTVRGLIAYEEANRQGERPACSELIGTLHALADPEADIGTDLSGGEAPAGAAAESDGASAETPAAGPTKAEAHKANFVRVDTEKLDDLVNMMGELVIAYSLVTSRAGVLAAQDPQLARETAQMAKIIKDLQERAMALRMVPIKGVFDRMTRLVYDLSRKTEKQVELRRSGDDTEVDKNVVEEIVDPLIHLVRNSVDHGVETPEERIAAGKPAQGVVELSARHQGGNIVIELRDDGKGLNRDRIHAKAVERGVIDGDEELTDTQVYELIFQPGFSTAQTVTDISGRGVGLDVVRQNVTKLRGRVEVDSTPGQGSVFTISLPLTLAIIDGMVIAAGGERYILPLLSVVESLRPKQAEVHTVEGRGEMVRLRDSLYPVVRLQSLFDMQGEPRHPWDSLLVMLEGECGRYCLMVDELVGIQQVVIKGLAESMRGKGTSGCAILGDGHVGLILDVDKIFQLMIASPGGTPRSPASLGSGEAARAVAA